MKKTTQTKSIRKKTSVRKKSVPQRRLTPVFKGMDGLAKSFTSVGIPTVIQSEISADSGISAQLFRSGNMPLRSGYGIKIKL